MMHDKPCDLDSFLFRSHFLGITKETINELSKQGGSTRTITLELDAANNNSERILLQMEVSITPANLQLAIDALNVKWQPRLSLRINDDVIYVATRAA